MSRLTSPDLIRFQEYYKVFTWWKRRHNYHKSVMAGIRDGSMPPQYPGEYGNRMRLCGKCKRRLREEITKMENIVRPISPYLQEHRPCS